MRAVDFVVVNRHGDVVFSASHLDMAERRAAALGLDFAVRRRNGLTLEPVEITIRIARLERRAA